MSLARLLAFNIGARLDGGLHGDTSSFESWAVATRLIVFVVSRSGGCAVLEVRLAD